MQHLPLVLGFIFLSAPEPSNRQATTQPVAVARQAPSGRAQTYDGVQAAQDGGRANQLSLHPLSSIFGDLNVEYERRLSPRGSFLVAPDIGFKHDHSLGLEAGGRFYPGSRALSGFFLQPSASFHTFSGPLGLPTQVWGLHAKAGYQWMLADRIVVHLAGGVVYRAGPSPASSSCSNWMAGPLFDFQPPRQTQRGIAPDLSLAIGFAF